MAPSGYGIQGIDVGAWIWHHGCCFATSLMTNTQPTLQEVVTRLDALTRKLNDVTSENDRRALLKQFRALLSEADKLIKREAVV
jgi:hypothetical protein